MEDTLGGLINIKMSDKANVLILVLMEDTLGVVQAFKDWLAANRLNPCFNGRYSRRLLLFSLVVLSLVLILVLMEDTLGVHLVLTNLFVVLS